MAIGEFGGAPACRSRRPGLFDRPVLALRDEPRRAQSVARARRRDPALFQEPAQSAGPTPRSARSIAAGAEMFERSTRRYGKPDWSIDSTLVGGERVPVHITPVWERPFCRLLHFERMFDHAPRRPQPKVADRRADVGPLRHAAARHGRGVPAESRRLHHRLGRCAHGAAGGGPFRSRRLHRLRHHHPASPRRRLPCGRGVPAVGAGAGRGRAHGGRRTIPTCRTP